MTTGSITGTVVDPQKAPVPGASVLAVHEPSGTRYEATTRADGRFSLPGMRVGGPYTVTATLSGFQPQTVKEVVVSLGVSSDLVLTLGQAALTEEVTVTASTSEVFSSARTGAATAVSRDVIQNLPTISDRINDFARLSPQYSGGPFGGGFVGQDNRLNNITVDGSYFNNSFGLGGPARRPHGRHAHLHRRRRGDPDQRRPLRRPPGPLRRRRRQHGHPQRRQPVPRLRLLLDP